MTSSPATEAPRPPAAPVLPKPNSLGAWILASRPKTLVAGWAPVLVGTSIALVYGSPPIDRALGALFVAIAIQVGTNLVNDAADHARGADTDERLGPPRAVALGLLDESRVMVMGVASFALAGLVGLWLASVAGWWLLIPGAVALVAGILYTAGPKPLAYLGLGEVFVFVFFGLFATAGTTYVLVAGDVHSYFPWWTSLISGAALGGLATVLLEVNNLRDAPTDALVGKATLAVRLGDARCRKLIMALLVASYVFVVLSVFLPPLSVVFEPPLWPRLLPLLSIPLAVSIWRVIATGATGRALNPVLGRVARLEAVFGVSLSVGYALVWAIV